jgi:hypothetical protein
MNTDLAHLCRIAGSMGASYPASRNGSIQLLSVDILVALADVGRPEKRSYAAKLCGITTRVLSGSFAGFNG